MRWIRRCLFSLLPRHLTSQIASYALLKQCFFRYGGHAIVPHLGNIWGVLRAEIMTGSNAAVMHSAYGALEGLSTCTFLHH